MCFLLFASSISFGQQINNNSIIKISENEIISLTKILKKYKATKIANNLDIKNIDYLNLLTDSIYKIGSTLENENNSSLENDTLKIYKIADFKSSNNINDKNEAITTQENIEISEIKKELALLQKQLKNNEEILNNLQLGQNNLMKSVNKSNQTPNTVIKTIPVALISEVKSNKTDTIYINREKEDINVRKLDSLIFLKLQEKITELEYQLVRNDSLQQKVIDLREKPAETSTIKLVENTISSNKLNLANQVFFNNNISKLDNAQQLLLNEIISYLKSDLNTHISLKGYASNSGNKNYNKLLSLKRTEAVEAYFIENGIESKRIFTNYFGIDYSKTDAEKARRVDFEFFDLIQ